MRSEDTGLRGIVWLFAVSVAVTVGCIVASYGLAQKDGGHVPAAAVEGVHLETFPPMGVARQQQKERDHLLEYGWIDAQHTRVHIPIETAMDVWLARQGRAP